MIEQNPYESKGDEIPTFVKKDDVDLSVLKLNENEIDEEPEEDEPKRKVNLQGILMITSAVFLVLIILLLVLLVSKGNQYKSLESTYQTYVSTADAKVERLEREIETLNAQIEELKKTTPENGGSSEGGSSSGEGSGSGSSTTTLTTGKYLMVYDGLNLRIGPGTGYDKCNYNSLPEEIKREAYDNSALSQNTEINVSEVKVDGDYVWGKIAENVWVCIKSGNTTYVKKIQ